MSRSKYVPIRQPGVIPPLKRKLNARRWLFFDTETQTRFKDANHKRLTFRLGYAVYVEFDAEYNLTVMREYEIRKPQDFVVCLNLHLPGAGILRAVAHNLQFDIQVLNLPQLLTANGYKTNLPILAFGACMWTAHCDKATVHFMDSQNIFPGKLEKLGAEIGRAKLKVDYTKLKTAELMEYCKNDCHILRVAFTRYLQWLYENKLGYFGETVSWQAFNAYRTRFMAVPITVHVDYVVLDYERQAYHGARTECFFVGQAPEEEYTLLDVNSMYAHVMAENEFPVEYDRLVVRPSLDKLSKLMEEYYVIADTEIETEEAAYPLRTGSKLVFPTGVFRCWLHQIELQHAQHAGTISRVTVALAYRKATLFRAYVDFFGSLKERASDNHDHVGTRLAKQFLLALYGKWGQKNPVTMWQGHTDEPGVRFMPAKCVENGRVWDEWHWFGDVYQTVKVGEKPYACPSIAGAITAYGRMYLWRLMNEAGLSNVYYVDTDSLLVNSDGLKALSAYLDPTALGKLKVAGHSSEFRAFGPKDYVLGSVARRKGVDRDILSQKGDSVVGPQFRSMSYRLKSGNLEGVDVYEVTKHRKATYDKGRVGEDGVVVPWKLPDDQDQPVFQE